MRIDSPPQVSLFAYDNDTFVIESFRADDAKVTITIPGERKSLRDAVSGKALEAMAVAPVAQNRRGGEPLTDVTVTIPPHSFRVFRIGDVAH